MKPLGKLAAAIVGAVLAGGIAQAQGLQDVIEKMGAERCADSSLLCVTIEVPRDHFANDPSETLPITFAVSPASEQSEGILFYAVGGPGGSGLASAESYIAAFDQDVQSRLDFVFFDQRGTGPDHGLDCPLAQGVFDRSEVTLADEAALLATVQSYVIDCQAELDRTDILPFVGTSQAIRDLELFRQAIGAPKVWLYGESYGTQFMQSYATAFPDAVRGLILDGVVDLNLSAEGFYRTYVQAAERILSRMFSACDADPACAKDMKATSSSVYASLIGQVSAGRSEVDFPLIDGTSARRMLTAGMIESNAFYALYSPEGRATFLRALAAFARGNAVPMLRQAYSNLYIDPDTEEGLADPSWFGAAYFANNCMDYGDGAGTPEADARRILDQARALEPAAPNLFRSYYLERLVCAYWPGSGKPDRPKPFVGGDYPTLILNSDTDPITPVSMAYSVYDNARNATMVVMQGGPHVIWGRGLSCPDKTVSRLIFDGAPPPAPLQLCRQDFLAPYIPLTLTDATLPIDGFALGQAVEAELDASADFADWSYSDVLEYSCDHGGRIEAIPTDLGAALQFTGCAMWPDLTLYGEGTVTFAEDGTDVLTLDLDVLGKARGSISYSSDRAAGTAWVKGRLDGRDVAMPRPGP
ncbi:MAG: alpha/beta fold hydrolase [Pseudomonadota bacterium]